MQELPCSCVSLFRFLIVVKTGWENGPIDAKKAITKTQIGWITGSVVWLNVSLNRLLVAMENLYWLSVSVNSSGGDRASLGFETVHLGSATRLRLAVHWLCISKGVVDPWCTVALFYTAFSLSVLRCILLGLHQRIVHCSILYCVFRYLVLCIFHFV